MKENSKANQVAKFIMDNPTMSRKDIATHFGVTRQRIAEICKKCLTPEQNAARENASENADLETIIPLVEEKTAKAIIVALTGFSATKVDTLFKHPSIVAILEKHENEKNDEIEKMSIDWFAGMTINEMKKKYGWEWSLQTCSGHICNLRKKYPEKFPIRLHNQTPLQEQFESYGKLKSEGSSAQDIAKTLGYKNVASMKAAFNLLNKKHESPTT